MPFSTALDPILSSPGKIRLLRALYKNPSRRWTGRELARECATSVAQTARDLGDFLDSGLVARDVLGRSYSWRLNEELRIGRALASLFEAERELPEALRTELQRLLQKLPIRESRLFGSVARGEETPESDVDLFLEVGSEAAETLVRDSLEAACTMTWLQFGIPLSPLIFRAKMTKSASASALMRAIKKEGIPLAQT